MINIYLEALVKNKVAAPIPAIPVRSSSPECKDIGSDSMNNVSTSAKEMHSCKSMAKGSELISLNNNAQRTLQKMSNDLCARQNSEKPRVNLYQLIRKKLHADSSNVENCNVLPN